MIIVEPASSGQGHRVAKEIPMPTKIAGETARTQIIACFMVAPSLPVFPFINLIVRMRVKL
jgi:hypothetical protein